MKKNKPLKVSGTAFMGEIHAPYKKLNKVFGKKQNPYEGGDRKTSAEWHHKTKYGPATIYDYKEHKGYGGVNKRHQTNWHVGGKRKEVVGAIQSALNKYK